MESKKTLIELFRLFFEDLVRSQLTIPSLSWIARQMDDPNTTLRVDITVAGPDGEPFQIGEIGYKSEQIPDSTRIEEGALVGDLKVTPFWILVSSRGAGVEEIDLAIGTLQQVKEILSRLQKNTEKPISFVLQTKEEREIEEAQGKIKKELEGMKIRRGSVVYLKDPDRFGYPPQKAPAYFRIPIGARKTFHINVEVGGEIQVHVTP